MIGFEGVSFIAAFVAGLLSFFTPCVLPLVPTFLVYISGLSVAGTGKRGWGRSLIGALLFVFGFSLVFIALGATATTVGGWLLRHGDWFVRIGGAIIVLFGLHIAGLVRFPFLEGQKRFVYGGKLGLWGAPIIGIVFAFGWSPCVGPILASILGLAAFQGTVGRGVVLLAAYSAGLAIPFLLSALAMDAFTRFTDAVKRRMEIVNILAGKLIVLMGILLLSGSFRVLSGFSHFDLSVVVAGAAVLAILFLEIYLLIRADVAVKSAGLERFPRQLTALYFVDVAALAAVIVIVKALAAAG